MFDSCRSLDVYSGGGRRGSRFGGYVRVQEPADGFFVAGSSLDRMNGLYGRVFNVPTAVLMHGAREVNLAYKHDKTGWLLVLVKPIPEAVSEGYETVGGTDNEWLFIDELFNDKFGHPGRTLIPGAGVYQPHPFLVRGGWLCAHFI